MFDWLVETFASYPHLGVALVFLLCGLGLPLPEEIVLVAAGYVSFKGFADPYSMMATCAGAILLGDLVPFMLGRIFGPRLLRLRALRMVVNRRRLAKFDLWFRRRGVLVVFFARFVPGIRVVAYFTAGTLRMSILRFVILDVSGIALICPPLVWVGYRFGAVIDDAILRVQQVERGILWTVLAGVLVLVALHWIRRRRRGRDAARGPTETYVKPTVGSAGTDGEVVEVEAEPTAEVESDPQAREAKAKSAPESDL